MAWQVVQQRGVCAPRPASCVARERAHQAVRAQLFVWLGHSAPRFDNLTAATPTRLCSVPAVSSLLGSDEGASLAQRLGARSRALPRRVLVAAHLPHFSAEDRSTSRGLLQPARRLTIVACALLHMRGLRLLRSPRLAHAPRTAGGCGEVPCQSAARGASDVTVNGETTYSRCSPISRPHTHALPSCEPTGARLNAS